MSKNQRLLVRVVIFVAVIAVAIPIILHSVGA